MNLDIKNNKNGVFSGLAILIFCAILGLFFVAFSMNSESALMFWGLGCFGIYRFYKSQKMYCNSTPLSKILACFLLIGSAILGFFNLSGLAEFFILIAILLFFGGIDFLLGALIPILLWFAVVPNIESINQILSYPIRIISSQMSSFILSCFGYAVSTKDSVIYLNDNALAITAACSGIEQLETILAIAWVWVVLMQNSLLYRIIQFSFTIPAVIFANALRLITMMLLTDIYGEDFIGADLHFWLGIGMIIVSSLIVIGIGNLFPKAQ